MTEMELRERLERLERDNRRMKKLGVAALAVAAALGAMAATRPVPQKITAHEFDVVDNSGKPGVLISAVNGPEIDVLDAKSGLPRVAIGSVSGPDSAGIWLFDGHGSRTVTLTNLQRSESNISLFGTRGAPRTTIALAQGEPIIELLGPQGFGMDLGSTNTVTSATGATQQTSAASIVMFGNDKKHHVIWRAP